jgi:DNA excision repair protein ERCC-2
LTTISEIKLNPRVLEYFPYSEVRPYQDVFINTVFEAVENRRHVLIEGSNGLGKTVSALTACLPFVKDDDLKILYVAKTHRQHERVIEELAAITKRQKVSGLSVRGRTEMCFHPYIIKHAPDAKTAMEICELLKSRDQCQYFVNIEKKEDRFADLLSHVSSHTYKASEVQEICRKEGFCPYELVKKAVAEVDVVALSYMYVFDPGVRSAFLKHLDKPSDKIILVVDEAHNLPDTAVEIASDALTVFAMRQAEFEAERFGRREMADFSRKLQAVTEKFADQVERESCLRPQLLIDALSRKFDLSEPEVFFEEMHATGDMIKQHLLTQGKYPRSFLHHVGDFLLHWLETSDDIAYTHVLSRYVALSGGVSAKLEVVALDPARVTEPVFSSVYCSVNMSGTLQPLQSYVKMTHLPDSTICQAVPSPFPEEHILSLTCCGVTTAMEQRTPSMYKKICRRIGEIVRNTPANTGVFTASYEVLQRLLDNGIQDRVDKPLLNEHRGMKSKENERLVRKFKSYAGQGGAVLLGVQGGRSSEGTDYPGDQMNSVAVVGVPYAEPTPKVKAQINYYERRFSGHGREYGYVIPALKKAAQAAGRPIRTLEDRGAIIFLDQRFATPYCQNYLPEWIKRGLQVLPDEDDAIASELKKFYSSPDT